MGAMLSRYQPHCVLAVLAVDDLTSLDIAESILADARDSRYICIYAYLFNKITHI